MKEVMRDLISNEESKISKNKSLQSKKDLASNSIYAIRTIILSKLFTIKNKNQKRQYLKNEEIVSIDGGTIIYQGEELRTDDEDLFHSIINLALCERVEKNNYKLTTSAYKLLNTLKWDTNSRSYNRLDACLSRLKSNSVKISSKYAKITLSVSLIRRVSEFDEDGKRTGEMNIYLEPEIYKLFCKDDNMLINWEQRLKLSPLAKKIHSALESKINPIKISDLYLTTGSETSLINFKKVLKRSLNEMIDKEVIHKFEIIDDFIHIKI
ncbi:MULTISPECIES: plasmid replication initiator TrfA [Cysteiniphilum]|uniref:Uncharacterized protein n=1 Tax=Cysteiniphilum litorale TaxID=2056700 RepID=A0A8J2Z3N1_9GAMM|nr:MULTISPECIES: plasmid replication initiator TrfA [Cysteiniphilum]GGF92119.1 hypothetical protein GCM10010995_06620 [Cysteiniphilum litorale]